MDTEGDVESYVEGRVAAVRRVERNIWVANDYSHPTERLEAWLMTLVIDLLCAVAVS